MKERKGTSMSLKVKSPDLLFVIFLLHESTGKKATEKMKRIAKRSNNWSPDKTQEWLLSSVLDWTGKKIDIRWRGGQSGKR